jgi:hypothetical protein
MAKAEKQKQEKLPKRRTLVAYLANVEQVLTEWERGDLTDSEALTRINTLTSALLRPGTA